MDAKAIRTAVGTILATVAVSTAILSGAPTTAQAEPVGETPLYYLENRNTGESLFTVDRNERDTLREGGWTYVKVSLFVPTESDSPVYRLFNPFTDNHLYTQDPNEYETLASYGWQQEGEKFYSDDLQRAPMYRLFASWIDGQGSHIYSTDDSYYRQMISAGWSGDGARWYGVRKPSTNAEAYQGLSYPDLDYSGTGQGGTVVPPEVGDPNDEPEQPNEGTVTPGEGRQDVIAYARTQIGWPYVSAGESHEEGGFDCSGLTYFVYKHFGVELPRTTTAQMSWLKSHGTWTTDIEKLKPGDLIVMEWGGHVGIFVGMDPETGRYMMIDAPHPGEYVQEREVVAYYYNRGFLGGGSVL